MPQQEADLFGGRFVGYIGPITTSMRHSSRPNKHQLPYEISCDVLIGLKDDMPVEEAQTLLARKKTDIEDYISAHLLEPRKDGGREYDKMVETVTLEGNYIRIRRNKFYGSEETRNTIGRTKLEQWQEKIRHKLFPIQQIEPTDDHLISPELCISPNYPFSFEGKDYTSLVIWTRGNSPIIGRSMLEEVLRNIETQFRPNLTGIKIQLVEHEQGDHIKVRVALTPEQNNRSYRSGIRNELMQITRATGHDYSDVPAHEVPDHVIKKLIERGVRAEQNFPAYNYIYYEASPAIAERNTLLPSDKHKHRFQLGIAPSLDVTKPGDYEIKSHRSAALKEALHWLEEQIGPLKPKNSKVTIVKRLGEFLDIKISTPKNTESPQEAQQHHHELCETVETLLKNGMKARKQTQMITSRAFATPITRQTVERGDDIAEYSFTIHLQKMGDESDESLSKNVNKLWTRLVFQLNAMEVPAGLKAWRNEDDPSITVQVLATSPTLSKVIAQEVQKKIIRSNHLPIVTSPEQRKADSHFTGM